MAELKHLETCCEVADKELAEARQTIMQLQDNLQNPSASKPGIYHFTGLPIKDSDRTAEGEKKNSFRIWD